MLRFEQSYTFSSWPDLIHGCPVRWFCTANPPRSVTCCPSSPSAGTSLSPLASAPGRGLGGGATFCKHESEQ
jgi:hypothetical protein